MSESWDKDFSVLLKERKFREVLSCFEEKEKQVTLSAEECEIKAICQFHLKNLTESLLEWKRVLYRNPTSIKAKDAVLFLEHLLCSENDSQQITLKRKIYFFAGCTVLISIIIAIGLYGYMRNSLSKGFASIYKIQQEIKTENEGINNSILNLEKKIPDHPASVEDADQNQQQAEYSLRKYFGKNQMLYSKALLKFSEGHYADSINFLNKIDPQQLADQDFLIWIFLYGKSLQRKYGKIFKKWNKAQEKIGKAYKDRILNAEDSFIKKEVEKLFLEQ